jgi:N-acetylglucosaminyl-diphospho-decaprenol L-rhamnosyltransferase
VAERVAAVVVDYHAGALLAACVDSLRADGVTEIVVVNNAAPGDSSGSLGARAVVLVEPGVNLGYGRGVNRGAAAAAPSEFLLVSNPDVAVHPGAVPALVHYLDAHREVGVVGPTIVTSDGSTYPSVRVFPDVALATMHALCAWWWPSNPWTRRYRSPGPGGHADWVSGAFFMIRRELFERLGGFDESYFMFAEDMDLCWRAGRAGARVGACEQAVVTHVEGVSRSRAPVSMVLAHHRSAMRFEWHTARGLRRLLAPLALGVLGVRLVAVLAREHFARRGSPPASPRRLAVAAGGSVVASRSQPRAKRPT